MSFLNKYIKDEDVLVRIKTKSDIGFWEYKLLGILSLFVSRRNDYFIITDKRILLYFKDNIKANIIYKDFSNIKFNIKTDVLSFINKNNQTQKISLSNLKLDYADYQFLKSKLN